MFTLHVTDNGNNWLDEKLFKNFLNVGYATHKGSL